MPTADAEALGTDPDGYLKKRCGVIDTSPRLPHRSVAAVGVRRRRAPTRKKKWPATPVPSRQNMPAQVGDVDGVRIAGLLLQAGPSAFFSTSRGMPTANAEDLCRPEGA